jgi:hypothetical protein
MSMLLAPSGLLIYKADRALVITDTPDDLPMLAVSCGWERIRLLTCLWSVGEPIFSRLRVQGVVALKLGGSGQLACLEISRSEPPG